MNWLNHAANAGSCQATLILAAALARGEFKSAKNESNAELLLKPLADNGDVEAQFILVWLYMFSEKFAEQRSLARKYLVMAVKAGHKSAAIALKSLPLDP